MWPIGYCSQAKPYPYNWSDRPCPPSWPFEEHWVCVQQARRPRQPSPGKSDCHPPISGQLHYNVCCLFVQGYIRAEPINNPVTTETRALAIRGLATLVYPHFTVSTGLTLFAVVFLPWPLTLASWTPNSHRQTSLISSKYPQTQCLPSPHRGALPTWRGRRLLYVWPYWLKEWVVTHTHSLPLSL